MVVELVFSLLTLILSGNLLYLYKQGIWIDPNRLILIGELVCLSLSFLGGLANSARIIGRLFHKE